MKKILILIILNIISFQVYAADNECKKTVQPVVLKDNVLKVAMMYAGKIGDYGWNYQQEQARLAIEKQFAGKIVIRGLENIPESSDAERVVKGLAEQGTNLVIGTAFGYMESLKKQQCEYKSVRFEHATGYTTSDNFRTYDVRGYEGAYLAGIIAGGITTTNIIGVVAPIPIPEILRNINSFTLGAQTTNPKITTKVIWVNEWYNPTKESEAAMNLINLGADILLPNTDSIAALEVTEKRGKYAFAWGTDLKGKKPVLKDPEQIGEKMGIIGVSRCLVLSTVSNSPANSEMNMFYNKAKGYLASTSPAIMLQGAAILKSQSTYINTLNQSQISSEYRNCVLESSPTVFPQKSIMASIVFNWTPYYAKTINEVLSGSWVGGKNTELGYKDGAISLDSLSNEVPNNIRSKVDVAIDGLKNGTLNIWKGPIYNQSGTEVLKPGEIADAKLLDRMNFYVKGVDSKVPGRN